ncbi:HU family DNA-binding protein [Roseibium marinum]|uniref:Nucleoid DNA-binding protein n=1 Tax=Roseibium marinum TaxID=281252 RepID=A0A2S3US87_9HYPH|nr:HU family DNA-binding protein [Roseibium marinum]POF30524.1 nucleoid DNA-binding protein [Roseibium marinum]
MAEKISHYDLIAKIAMNAKLTAAEVEEALEVLSVVIQSTLQEGGSVDLLGVGTFTAEGDEKRREVHFKVGESLAEIVSEPSIKARIERQPGILSGTLFSVGPADFAHKVNVC